jgi:LPXTG-motif cell wall-anchored protein
VTFTQDPSDATKITISIYNVNSYEMDYPIGITNPDDLGMLIIGPGETGTSTVTAPVGSEIWIGGFGCPEAIYTVPAGPTPTPTSDAPSGSLSQTTVGQDHSLTVNGAGFEPNEPIQIWLHSTPIQLWSGTASAAGTISQSVVIPASIPTGAHQIEIRGATSGSVWLNLTVTAMLPATGLDTTATVLLAAGAVATLGAGTVLTVTNARRRRARA